MYRKLGITTILFFTLYSSISARTSMRAHVLRVELNKFKSNSVLRVYNKDGSVYAIVYRDEEEGEYKVKDASNNLNNHLLKDIRAYYLDYGLIIFDADTIESGLFPIYVGNKIKYIKSSEIQTPLISFQSWQSFFKTVFLKLTRTSAIYADTSNLKKIRDANKYSYSVKKIVGKWAYVECLKTCEQCPSGAMKKGWVRWRDGNTLLVNLFYFC